MNPTDIFDTDDAGNVIAKPLVGYSTMPVAGMFILTRLEWADTEDHLAAVMSDEARADALQLALTPHQARELATRLNFLADHILAQETPGKPGRN